MTTTDYENIRITKTDKVCSLCEDHASEQRNKPIVVMSCEGGCLRGEIARQATNILCVELAPEKTALLCLGGAFTKDIGQRALVRNASNLVADRRLLY
jgi:S-adenosylmethionine:diacylglycerol 3-amino-3-carboxypropyl transferase